jgi:hypothetical protein
MDIFGILCPILHRGQFVRKVFKSYSPSQKMVQFSQISQLVLSQTSGLNILPIVSYFFKNF